MKLNTTLKLFFILMMNITYIYGQEESPARLRSGGFEYTYYWEKDEVIGYRSSTDPLINANPQKIPMGSILFAGNSSQINLRIDFTDIDYGKCGKIKGRMQFPRTKYQIDYKSNNNGAVFTNGTQNYSVLETEFSSEYIHPLLVDPYRNLSVFRVSALPLNILSTWDRKDITITVKIIDISKDNLGGDTGDPNDFSKTLSWTIRYQNQCPLGMQKVNTPAENTWTDQNYTAIYGVLPLSTNFEGTVITEIFGPVTSGGLFQMSDLRQDWLDMNPNVITPDIAAEMIFMKPMYYGSSFQVNANNQFDDTHSGLLSIVKPYYSNLKNYFYPSPIQQNKAGYMIEQSYQCSGIEIGKADLFKRYYFVNTSSNATQLKKNHNF